MLEGLRLSEKEGRGGAEGRIPSGNEFSPGPGFVFGLVIVLLGKELDMAQASPSLNWRVNNKQRKTRRHYINVMYEVCL